MRRKDTRPEAARFWGNVNKQGPDDCWLWTGKYLENGNFSRYGLLQVEGRLKRAHRVSYELHHGVTIGPRMEVCHSCDTTLCVNPQHLRLGTHADNLREMALKGRAGPNRKPHVRLGVEGARRACQMFLAGVTKYEIARQLGVAPGTIQQIWQGRSYRAVYAEYFGGQRVETEGLRQAA